MIKKTAILLMALVMLASFPAFAQPEAVSLTDMAGREVTLIKPVRRIVALQPADCEILFAVGAGSMLVGRGEYCDYPQEVLNVPAVQSGNEMNLEQIIALEPDAVIMPKMAQTQAQVDALQKAGITAVITDAQNIRGVYQAIGLLGRISGKEMEADQLISSMETTFDELRKKANDQHGYSVYFEVSPLQWGLWAAGGGSFMDEIAQVLNLNNIFAELPAWAEVSEEQVISRNPDCIVTTAMYFGEGPSPMEEMVSRAGWEMVTAIRTGQVYHADSDAITRPGPRLVEAAQDLYAFLYGE